MRTISNPVPPVPAQTAVMTTTRLAPAPLLTAPAAVTLYIGALLGPSLLLLPGVVARMAGPASVLVWAALLLLSALLAWVFAALGARMPGGGGAADYVRAAFGPRLATLVHWWFVAGVVLGAPLVCVIGAGYLARLLDGSQRTTLLLAAALLGLVMLLTSRGRAVGGRVQIVLVGALVLLVLLAVVGAAPHADATLWQPFAPHGWGDVVAAAAPLMLCFVGWEAIAPLVGRLADPARQLPRVVATAWSVTASLYLALAVAAVAVLGGAVGLAPLAQLLAVGVGSAGEVLAAVVAVAVTLAATNAYISGAGQMIASRAPAAKPGHLTLAIGAAGALTIGVLAAGLPIEAVVNLPTAMFLAVYVASTAAAVTLLRGPVRMAAALAAAVTAAVLVGTGWALLCVVALTAVVVVRTRSASRPRGATRV